VDSPTHHWLVAHPGALVTIDLPARTLSAENGLAVRFNFDPFEAHCLIHGVDELKFLMSHADQIAAYEARIA
jgi:3-isopropylmalate/(R)-2-methylmalate dehydratase small subunit